MSDSWLSAAHLHQSVFVGWIISLVIHTQATDLIEGMPKMYDSPAVQSMLLDVRGGLLLCDIGARPSTVDVDAGGHLTLSGERTVRGWRSGLVASNAIHRQ